MFLMFLDESGDCGTINSPSRFFVLSALVVHESHWQTFLDDLIVFRRDLKTRYGLLMREEIHASEFINGSPKLKGKIQRNDRLDLLKKCLEWLNNRTDISVISVRCEKKSRTDVFEFTWRAMIQRFDNTLAHRNFPHGNGSDKGIMISDNTDGGKLTKLLRSMRRYNSVPSMFGGSRQITLRAIVEDPIFRDSAFSYVHQMVDVVAYFARQHYEPNKYVRKKGARNFYLKLSGVVNKYATTARTPHKIVEI